MGYICIELHVCAHSIQSLFMLIPQVLGTLDEAHLQRVSDLWVIVTCGVTVVSEV